MNAPIFFHTSVLEIVKSLGAMPFWKMLSLILGFVCCVVFILILFTHHTRRLINNPPLSEGAAVGNDINACVYGLILAFLVVTMHDTNHKAEGSVFDEANTLAAILEISKPLQNAPQIREAVKSYIHDLLQKEWPLMCSGNLPEAWKLAPQIVAPIYDAIQSSQPVGAVQEQCCSTLMDLLKELSHDYRSRLLQAEIHLPLQFWRVIVLMSILSLAFLAYMNPWTGNIHSLIPIVIPGMIIALSLALIISLQYPYQGPFAISNKVYSSGVLDFSQDQEALVTPTPFQAPPQAGHTADEGTLHPALP